jgi:hypothetical protein
MVREVKTTTIEKKYTDKKGVERTLTIEYAKAADRLKQFREDCPRGVIETNFQIDSGNIIFTAKVTKDGTKESATATAHAMGINNGDKAFEKLETISVARALALLGYLAGGEVASSEEMEEFYEYKFEKYKTDIEQAKSVDELMSLFNEMNADEKKEFTNLLSNRKKELLDEAK